MKPADVIAAVKKILEEPVGVPLVLGDPENATERLILMVSAFLSLEDQHLVGAIYAEAQNRLMISKAIGKHPWEIGR